MHSKYVIDIIKCVFTTNSISARTVAIPRNNLHPLDERNAIWHSAANVIQPLFRESRQKRKERNPGGALPSQGLHVHYGWWLVVDVACRHIHCPRYRLIVPRLHIDPEFQ